MNTNYPLVLRAGDDVILDFGAQYSSTGQPLEDPSQGRSPLLAVLADLHTCRDRPGDLARFYVYFKKRLIPKASFKTINQA